MKLIHLIATFGFLLTFVAYLSRFPQALHHKYPTVIIGTLLLLSGYGMLILKEIKDNDKKVTPEYTKKLDNYQLIGYLLLSIFFIGSYIIPLNFYVRFYDIFAAFGFILIIIAKFNKNLLSLKWGLMVIILYYLFGGLSKIGESGFDDICLLIGRLLLTIVYSYKLLQYFPDFIKQNKLY